MGVHMRGSAARRTNYSAAALIFAPLSSSLSVSLSSSRLSLDHCHRRALGARRLVFFKEKDPLPLNCCMERANAYLGL